MPRVHSLEPVIGRDPRILILGSMPGLVSLEVAQYYANPRNAFWPIMAELFGIELTSDYARRIEQISRLPLALWDSIKACHRAGSLDASIRSHQLEVNDICGLLKSQSSIQLIAFNGAAAEKYFRQKVRLPHLEKPGPRLIRLPSTSPANASMSFRQKLVSWHVLLDYL